MPSVSTLLHDYTLTMTFARSPRIVRLAAFTAAALFAFGLSQPAEAQWKWKDKSGRVQYSDLPPPPNVSDSEILQRPSGAAARKAPAFAPNSAQAAAAAMAASAASAPDGGAPKGIDSELEAKRRKAADEEAAKRRAEEEKQRAARAENCQRAKANLRALDDGMRMARVNEKGEREILDDKARAEEAKRTRDVIASDCK
jgi:hypothetical protein